MQNESILMQMADVIVFIETGLLSDNELLALTSDWQIISDYKSGIAIAAKNSFTIEAKWLK